MQHGVLSVPDAMDAAALARRGVDLAGQVATDPVLFGTLIEAVVLAQGRVSIRLAAGPVAAVFGVPVDTLSPTFLAFVQHFALRRRGVETRIVAGETEPQRDPVLIRTLAEARGWARSLRSGTSLTEIAASIGRSEPYISARIALAFLAPLLQAAILEGRQAPDLSVARLIRDGIPMDWAEQARRFGSA